MNIEILRDFCISKKSVEETFPFGETTLVFKVCGKMFCLIGLDEPTSCNLKCDPERAIELRQKYNAVNPGFHMNKTHWNTITFNQDLPDKEIIELIEHSYNLVVQSLPKKLRESLS
jgi:predicted DNA-binding protein (MmcQ/YjbR family)